LRDQAAACYCELPKEAAYGKKLKKGGKSEKGERPSGGGCLYILVGSRKTYSQLIPEERMR